MEMQGEARIPAPKQVVWETLNDPEALQASIKGCEELVVEGENKYAAKVRAKVGPVSAKFAGKVELVDIDPPNGYRIQGEGSGGAAGFAKGGATVTLEEDGPNETLLKYDVSANVGGKLAQIGARLVDGAAKKMADDFFKAFSDIAAARAADGGSEGAAPTAAAAPDADQPAAQDPADAPTPAPEAGPEAPPEPAGDPLAAGTAPAATGANPAPTEDGKRGGVPTPIWIGAACVAVVILAVILL